MNFLMIVIETGLNKDNDIEVDANINWFEGNDYVDALSYFAVNLANPDGSWRIGVWISEAKLGDTLQLSSKLDDGKVVVTCVGDAVPTVTRLTTVERIERSTNIQDVEISRLGKRKTVKSKKTKPDAGKKKGRKQ